MNSSRVLPILLFLGLILTLAVVQPAAAQDGTPTEDDVNRIARDLYCPVCENIPLDTCGTKACEQWRGVIRDKLAEGWTDEEIKTYFVEQYGDRVLAEPPRSGFNWLVYLVPPVVFILGLILVFLGYQRWKVTDSDDVVLSEMTDEVSEVKPPEKYLKMVEDELRKRKDE